MISIRIDQVFTESGNMGRNGRTLLYLEDEILRVRKSLDSLSGMDGVSGRLVKIIEQNRRTGALCQEFRAVLESTAKAAAEYENRIIDYGAASGIITRREKVTETDILSLEKRFSKLLEGRFDAGL